MVGMEAVRPNWNVFPLIALRDIDWSISFV